LDDVLDIVKPTGEIMKRKCVRCAPLIQYAIDKLGWKSSFYFVREGYNNILFNSEVPLKSIICNNI